MVKHRLLFVCLGNICRSSIAQGAFAQLAASEGVGEQFMLDSAGTGGWHIGDPPDPRAVAAAFTRGIDISDQRARQISRNDFSEFDYLLAMDRDNISELRLLAPQGAPSRISLFLDGSAENDIIEVPDPYYGGPQGFEEVLDLVEAGSKALLARLT